MSPWNYEQLDELKKEIDEMATALREISKWIPELKKECEEMATRRSGPHELGPSAAQTDKKASDDKG